MARFKAPQGPGSRRTNMPLILGTVASWYCCCRQRYASVDDAKRNGTGVTNCGQCGPCSAVSDVDAMHRRSTSLTQVRARAPIAASALQRRCSPVLWSKTKNTVKWRSFRLKYRRALRAGCVGRRAAVPRGGGGSSQGFLHVRDYRLLRGLRRVLASSNSMQSRVVRAALPFRLGKPTVRDARDCGVAEPPAARRAGVVHRAPLPRACTYQAVGHW